MADQDPYADIATPIDPYADIAKPIPAPPTPGFRDRMTAAVNDPSNVPDTGWRGQIENFGQGAAQMMNAAILHPVQTAISGANALMAAPSGSAAMTPGMAMTGNRAIDAQNEQAVSGAQAEQAQAGKQMAANPANTLGQLAGGFAAGHILPAIPEGVGRPIQAVGEGLESAGVDSMNKTLKAGQKAFRYDHDPGRAVLEEGPGTSLAFSRQGLADNVNAARQNAGQAVGDVVAANANVPVSRQAVGRVVNPVLQRKVDVLSGVGGAPAQVPGMRAFGETFDPLVNGEGSLTAGQLYDARSNVDENINWGRDVDATDATLNNARREIRSGLSDQLYQAVPQLEAPSQRYASLATASKLANDRTFDSSGAIFDPYKTAAALSGGAVTELASHSPGMAAGAALATRLAPEVAKLPIVRTGTATGLFQAGRGIGAVGRGLRSLGPSPVDVNAPTYEPTESDQGTGQQPAADNGYDNQPVPPARTTISHTVTPNPPIRGLLPSGSAGALGSGDGNPEYVTPAGSPPPPLNPATAQTSVYAGTPKPVQPAVPQRVINVSPEGKAVIQRRALPPPPPRAKPKKLNETKTFQQASVAALPGPIKRVLRETGATIQPATGNQGSNPEAVASVSPDAPNTIQIEDPARFNANAGQTIAHEAYHVWRNNLPPHVRAMAPQDDTDQNNYADPGTMNRLRAQGKRLWDLPEESGATAVQYYTSQGGENAPKAIKDAYKPWVDDMNTDMSNIEPTPASAQQLNTTPRPPTSMYMTKTFAEPIGQTAGKSQPNTTELAKGSPVRLHTGEEGKVSWLDQKMKIARVKLDSGKQVTAKHSALQVIPHIQVQAHVRRINK